MKTKQIFIALISSVLVTACATDDNILNDDKNDLILESVNTFTQIPTISDTPDSDEGPYIIYRSYTIFYPLSPFSYRSNYEHALIYRAELKLYDYDTNYPIYRFPDTINFEYINGIYSEKIEEIFFTDISPRGGEDDIEL